MITRFDKAGIAAIGTAATTLLMAFTELDEQTVAAVGTVLTAVLTYWIPNKGA